MPLRDSLCLRREWRFALTAGREVAVSRAMPNNFSLVDVITVGLAVVIGVQSVYAFTEDWRKKLQVGSSSKGQGASPDFVLWDALAQDKHEVILH